MKTYAVWLFALSAGLALSVPAIAEPFNDRGPDYIARVRTGTRAPAPVVAVAGPDIFNERGEDYIVTAPLGSDAPRQQVAARFGGFNDRDYGPGHSGYWDSQRRVVVIGTRRAE